MHWRVKGVVQRALSAVPGGVWMNDRLQQSLGGLRDFNGTIENKVVNDWLVLVDHMRQLGFGPRGIDYLEIGTGWIPVLPVCFSLAGASTGSTVDIACHLDAKLTLRMLARLEGYLPGIAEASGRPLAEVKSDYAELRRAPGLKALLERARIRYLSPADARSTGLASDSLDMVYSNNVFEHVPAGVLGEILEESRRILRPGGLSIHSANCADHYAYFDRSITFLNYLAYSERQWRFWNSKLQYQNRLRPRDFADLTARAGLEVKLYKMRTREELRGPLSKMKIAAEFQKYDADQLCSTSILVGGVKNAPRPAPQPAGGG